RVELAVPSRLGEVTAELIEHEGAGTLARATLAAALRAACRTGADGAAGLRGALRGAALSALVTGEQLDDLLTHARQVGAELHQDLGCDALTLADEAEQQELGADVLVAHLEAFTQGELEDLLGTRGEGDVAGVGLGALTDDLLH